MLSSYNLRHLLVPGLHNSGPGHWQTAWEETRPDCSRVQMGSWESPDAAQWTAAIDRSVEDSPVPVVFAAHSLGCLAVALWAAHAKPSALAKIRGALLVAPPDVRGQDAPQSLAQFRDAHEKPLPFRSILVASRNDPYATFQSSLRMAALWGARVVDAGDAGHINAQSNLGDWQEGQGYLLSLILGPALTRIDAPVHPATKSTRELVALRARAAASGGRIGGAHRS